MVRGGYGATSFYEGNSSNQRLTSITPFIQAVNVKLVTPTPGNPGTPRTAEQGFAGGTVAYGGTFNVYPQEYSARLHPGMEPDHGIRADQYACRCRWDISARQGQHIEDYGNINQYR